MKKLAIVVAVGATALIGSSAANAADHSGKAKATAGTSQSTDLSSRRYYRQYRHYGYRHYRPYYRSYGYAPRPYYGYGGGPYYGSGYGYGGPGVTFSFGTGGYRGW
jgi:hypothetical protein